MEVQNDLINQPIAVNRFIYSFGAGLIMPSTEDNEYLLPSFIKIPAAVA